MSKFCKKCGAPLPPEATFCNKCGAPVEAGTPASGPDLSANARLFSLGVLISGVVVALSTFLPYVSASVFGFSQSASLIDGGDGFFVIILAAVAVVGEVMKKRLVALIGGALTLLLCFFEMADTSSKLGDYSSFIDKGMGYYLFLIGSIALAAFCVLSFLAARKK